MPPPRHLFIDSCAVNVDQGHLWFLRIRAPVGRPTDIGNSALNNRPRHLWLLAATWLWLYLASSSIAQQAQPDSSAAKGPDKAGSFYQPDSIQVIRLQVGRNDLDKMRAALPRRIYVPATFRWGNQTLDNVGIRYKGNSSSNPNQRHKRSFLIKFDECAKNHRFLGLQRVALDNGVQFGSLFSERLITSVLQDLNVKAPRCNYAKLYINDQYQGVYVNVERIDTVFVKNHFADGKGPLYKVDEGGAGCNLAPFPRDPNGRIRGKLAFEPKSKSARREATDVLELIAQINETPAERFAQVMEATIDMEAFLKTMAVMLFSGAFDQLTGWNPHNYYLYRDPGTKRWHYLPWDLDVGFADNAFRRVPVISGWNAAWPVPGGPPKPLIERIVDNPQLLARYRKLADEILEKHFHPQVLHPKIDALYGQIKDDLADDPFPHRRVTNPEDRDYDSIVAAIKDFVQRRYTTARAQLDDPGDRPRIVRNSPGRGREPRPGKPSADAPSELRVAVQSATSVTLQWKDNAKGEMGFVVQRASGEKGQDFRNHIGQPGMDIVSAKDDRVVAGQTYRYRVYAVRPSPNGPVGTGLSNTVTVRVTNEPE